ncbi:MAG: hybrid sensor histidine kinase/response regulator [Ignavibacteria bacterium]|jgi:two-component system sensor histidine kinase/response regulator
MEEMKNKILVVDDIPKNIQIIANTLGKDSYSIAFATNGNDALKHAAKNKFDLILLDVSMPGMDGFEVSRKLKEQPLSKETPIIFITALSELESVLKGFEVGAVDYITKPFNSEELKARVNTQLEIKKQRDIVKRLNANLENKVKERTQQLVEANEKLKVLEKAKSDFLILISHELRTPLNGILGFAEILMDTVQDEESKEFVSNLMDSALRLSRFSEIALLITSLRTQRYPVEYTKADLIEIIRTTIEKFKSKLEEKQITIKEEYASEKINATIDIELLKKCLHQLLGNAIRFAPCESEVMIMFNNHDKDFEIIVKDNGDGFSEEAQKQLYDIFTTNNVMNHSEGFGLGLAAVKLIMDAHNGNVEIRNLEPKGAEVVLTIPKNI